MKDGKKSIAESLLYGAFDIISEKTNEDPLKIFEKALENGGVSQNIMIDCSHENSGKKHERQSEVMHSVLAQISDGNRSIIGAMIESNLEPGSQPFPAKKEDLKRGVSITDGCIGWSETEDLIRNTHQAMAHRFC